MLQQRYFYHFDIVTTSKQRRFNVMCRVYTSF